MEIIALSGFARSGKDEAAKVLVEEFGFKQVAFADKLREVLYALNPIVNYDSMGRQNIHVQDVINEWGWDGYKETAFGPEIRRLLQRLGTEAGRQTLWDSIWIDAAFANQPEDAKIVVPDCRFQNEARAIKERGGKIVRIRRAGVEAVNSHISEHDLDNFSFDYYIDNNSSIEDYRNKVVRFANELGL